MKYFEGRGVKNFEGRGVKYFGTPRKRVPSEIEGEVEQMHFLLFGQSPVLYALYPISYKSDGL